MTDAHQRPPRRVLYVFANGSLGGAEKITWLMLQHHDPSRYQPVALFLAPGPLPELIKATGSRHGPIPLITWTEPLRLSRPWTVIRAQRFVTAAIRDQRIGLVHSCLPYSHLITASATQRAQLPAVLFQHGPVGGWVDRLASVLPVDLILTNSAYTKGRVDERNVRRWPLAVLPLATEINITEAEQQIGRAEVNARFGWTDQEQVITIFARLTPGKGLDFAITALAPLLRAQPHLRLLMIGGPFRQFFPTYQAELTAQIEREKLTDQIVLGGFQSPITPFLARSDVIVSASFEEAFGLTLIEGMAAGKPVLASRVGGAAEVMTDGVDGRYFSPGDSVQLRSLAAELLADSDTRKAMGAAGRARVARDYSPAVMLQRLEAHYDQLFAARD